MKFVFQNLEGLIQEGSSEIFQTITGAQWTNEIINYDSTQDNSYYTSHKTDQQLMELVLPLYYRFKKVPPSLFVRLGTCQGRHSVHALQKILKGSVVSEYVGEWKPSSKENSAYRWGPIDALQYRNYSGLIEDGFPNIAPFHLYNTDGIALRIIFVALEDIEEGEMLTLNYGMNHSVKVGYHQEYQIEKMISFFSKNSIEKIFQHIQALRKSSPKELRWKRTLELEHLTAKIRYLYQTPGALFLLLLKGVLQGSEVFRLYEEPEFRYFFINFPLHPNMREKEIVHYFTLLKTSNLLKKVAFSTPRLLDHLRHRIFFSIFIQSIINDEDIDKASQEAIIWNEAFDALEQKDKRLLEFKFSQAQKRELLIQACLNYAYERRSPLITWLQSLTNPPLQFRPTG